MSKKFLPFCILFLFSITALAQSPKQILKEAERALGKEKAVEAMKSWRKSGLITREKDGSHGDFMMQGAKPALFNSKFDIEGFETETGFNGKSVWRRDSREGLKTLTGKESEDLKALALYRNWLWTDYKDQKYRVSGGKRTVVNNKYANLVVMTTPEAVQLKLYFDPETNLLLREEIPAGDEIRFFEYSDYRPIDGIKVAFRIRTNVGGETFVITLDQVIHNPQIAQSDFNFPNISGEPLPDIPNLLKELQANEDRVDEILENYSYTQKITKRELTDEGKLEIVGSETNQLSFYKGYRITRLIEKDGKPLTPKLQADEDKEVEKRVRRIEKRIAEEESRDVSQDSDGESNGDEKRISAAEILRASKLLNPRRERLKSRGVIVFDFEPNPDFDFDNAKSLLKLFGKTAGVMWIDEKDKQVVRLEAVLADSYKVGGGILAKLRKGASFTLENKRVNDEIWLPWRADINLSVRVLLFGGVKINQVIDTYDYIKFKTDVESAEVEKVSDRQ